MKSSSVQLFFGPFLAVGIVVVFAPMAMATMLYSFPGPPVFPFAGPFLPGPGIVPGKEYSHDVDVNTTGLGGVPDPERVIAWDGVGGTRDGLDFSNTRPSFLQDDEMDAIANRLDELFFDLEQDTSHLVFSVDDFAGTVPSVGPLATSGGNTIGGAGEVSYERPGGFFPSSVQGVWAKDVDINVMPKPNDVDGLEVWGPEPGNAADTDRYSLASDFASSVSVWADTGVPFVSHAAVISAVTGLLGAPFSTGLEGELPFLIDLDALMVHDETDGIDDIEFAGASDIIVFSIRQIPDLMDPDGFYATGSELFVLDGAGGASFLFHGGHLWDHSYALTDMKWVMDDGQSIQLDVNAIESVTASVPEPSSAMLSIFGLVGLFGYLWRRRRSVA